MTAVGDKQIIATQTLLLADGEVGKFEIPVFNNAITVEVKFVNPDYHEPKWHWEYTDGTLKLFFGGWRNPVGTGLPAPLQLGDVNKTPFGFNMVHQRVGTTNVATLQFYLGGTYE